VWIGALVVDIIRTANTPVKGQLLASVLTGAGIATAMFLSQLRKRKTPAKPQVEMPPWVPPMQTWYMGGILLLLAYLQLVTYGNAVGAAWASAWLSFSAPFSDLVSKVVPPLDTYSQSLTAHGYQDRVAIVRHAQAVSWVWLFIINIYMILWITRRWNFTKTHVKSQSIAKTAMLLFGGFVAFAMFCSIIIGAIITYENKPHHIFDLSHHIDASLLLNVIITPFFCIPVWSSYFSLLHLYLQRSPSLLRSGNRIVVRQSSWDASIRIADRT